MAHESRGHPRVLQPIHWLGGTPHLPHRNLSQLLYLFWSIRHASKASQDALVGSVFRAAGCRALACETLFSRPGRSSSATTAEHTTTTATTHTTNTHTHKETTNEDSTNARSSRRTDRSENQRRVEIRSGPAVMPRRTKPRGHGATASVGPVAHPTPVNGHLHRLPRLRWLRSPTLCTRTGPLNTD